MAHHPRDEVCARVWDNRKAEGMIGNIAAQMMAIAGKYRSQATIMRNNEKQMALANQAMPPLNANLEPGSGDSFTYRNKIANLAQQDKALTLQSAQAKTNNMYYEAWEEAAQKQMQKENALRRRMIENGALG